MHTNGYAAMLVLQGEEARIVILSLVRSRADGNIGFLRMKNRINVLLSRAKHGMYILGNADTLRKASEPPPEGSKRPAAPMWGQVLDMLEQDNSIGEAFEVMGHHQCPRSALEAVLVLQLACVDHFVRRP